MWVCVDQGELLGGRSQVSCRRAVDRSWPWRLMSDTQKLDRVPSTRQQLPGFSGNVTPVLVSSWWAGAALPPTRPGRRAPRTLVQASGLSSLLISVDSQRRSGGSSSLSDRVLWNFWGTGWLRDPGWSTLPGEVGLGVGLQGGVLSWPIF